MTRRRLYLAMLVGWVLFTLVLTSIPNPQFGPTFRWSDKVAHFGCYGAAGFLFVLWRRESGKAAATAVMWAVFFAAFLGAVDEVHQQWIPGRSMEFFDWVADFLGGTAGSLVAIAVIACLPSFLTAKNQPMSRPVTD